MQRHDSLEVDEHLASNAIMDPTPEQEGSIERALGSLVDEAKAACCVLSDLYGETVSSVRGRGEWDPDWVDDLAEEARLHFESGSTEPFSQGITTPFLPFSIFVRSIESTLLLIAFCPKNADQALMAACMEKRAKQITWILGLNVDPPPDSDPGAESAALAVPAPLKK